LNQTVYRNIVSGQDRRTVAKLLRLLLAGISLPYGAAVRIRNGLYRCGILRTHRESVPVISVGNITTGGTGKTPLVIWLCRYLSQKNLRCAILTRGYKTSVGEMPDEPALLAKSCPGVEVIVNPDRLSGAEKAIERFHSQVLVLDDGFQHRRIARDLNILAIDATCPFGYEKLLPAGLLREPLSGLRRADAVVITRFDLAGAEQIAKIEESIRQIAGDIPIARAIHRHTHAVTLTGQTLPLESLRQKKLFVYCGIGNPQAFVNCLTQDGMTVVGTKFFNDHYSYSMRDVRAIAAEAQKSNADIAVCTQKDWVKTAAFCRQIEEILFGCLVMELDFASHADIIQTLVDQAIEQKSGKTETP
jgi:tetraacyldisaccharide 4'-kinase